MIGALRLVPALEVEALDAGAGAAAAAEVATAGAGVGDSFAPPADAAGIGSGNDAGTEDVDATGGVSPVLALIVWGWTTARRDSETGTSTGWAVAAVLCDCRCGSARLPAGTSAPLGGPILPSDICRL